MQNKKKFDLFSLSSYFVLLAILVVFGIFGNNFLKLKSIYATINNGLPLILITCAVTFSLIVGIIDLSCAAIGYAAGVSSGMLMHWYGVPFPLALLVGLAIGAFLGWINSLLIVKLKMNGMLVTFGLQLVLRAYGRIITNDNTITLGDHVKALRQTRIAALGGLQVTVIVMIVFAVVLHLVLKYTAFGRKLLLVGCDENVAKRIGINADKVKTRALLLEGLPICGGELRGELCTPTGAALLRRFVRDFGPLPPMRLEKLGSGLGTKTFDRPNCLRAFLGEAEDASDRVLELQCNLDDMTGEEIAFACQRLLEAGALDVWTQAIQMKKGRPGVLLGVLCRPDRREELLRCLFLHTSTLGVRESEKRRAVLDREERCEDGPLGPVRVKRVSGWGTLREKTEYEDLRRLALEQGLSLRQARALAEGGSDPAEIH